MAGWRGGPAWPLVRRCACAAIAGLTTGLIAGGILLALRGTDWPLFANDGDSGQLLRWADDLLAGRPPPADYPPAIIHLIAWGSALTGESTARTLRAVQVVGTALFGPVAYLAWRLRLSPGWALAVTLIAALPLLEPYKPYTTVVLVVLVPVLIVLLSALRRVADWSRWRIAGIGLGTGVGLGLLFVGYSGWFLWSAPGVLAAALALFPWRAAPARGLALLAGAGAGLVLVAAGHLVGLLAAAGTTQDRYFYFDTAVDPAYIAMWRNDLPGDIGPWPPPGRAGRGRGLRAAVGGRAGTGRGPGRAADHGGHPGFAAGRGLAAAPLARLAGLRHRHGAALPADQRGDPLLPAAAVGVRGPVRVAAGRRAGPRGCPPVAATVGGLSAACCSGCSPAPRWPTATRHATTARSGLLAYVAQMVRQPDGTCPDYGPGCAASVGELRARPR